MACWRLWIQPDLKGIEHMAWDAALLQACEEEWGIPTIRLYTWNPACVTLGYHQKAYRDVDLRAVQDNGFDVARRITGGRALLHIGEVTYSIIARNDSELWCRSASDTYRMISETLTASLNIPDCIPGNRENYPVEKPTTNQPMSPCFATSAKMEILYQNRKVVGSAQRRTKTAFVQHGSITLSRRFLEIVDCMPLACSLREEAKKKLVQKAVSIEEILGKSQSPELWLNQLAASFPQYLGVKAQKSPPTESEHALFLRKQEEMAVF